MLSKYLERLWVFYTDVWSCKYWYLKTGRRCSNYALGYITLNKDVNETTLVVKGHILGVTSAAFSPGFILDARLPSQKCFFNKKVLSYFFLCMMSAQHISVTIGIKLSRGAALVAKSCGSAAFGDDAMLVWPWDSHCSPFLSPNCSLSWSSQPLPAGTGQGRGRSCCSLVTEAGSVLLMSQPLTYPHRGHSSLQQSHPWGQGCLPGAAKPRRAEALKPQRPCAQGWVGHSLRCFSAL